MGYALMYCAQKPSPRQDETPVSFEDTIEGNPYPAAPPHAYEMKNMQVGGSLGITGYIQTPPRFNPNFNTETYDKITDNGFLAPSAHPLSTFSIDVDTASYSNFRRFIQDGTLPPVDAVRIEEMINYFSYSYPEPSGKDPFGVHTEMTQAPWDNTHALLKVGLKARDTEQKNRKTANLVFLVDVSGSMQDANKLPLLKQGLKMMVQNLNAGDRVAIAVYAGASGLALDSTSNKKKILEAIDNLEAGGSTNGAQGIELAYQVAKRNFIANGINRVVLATDGDFNVGVTSTGELERLITEKAKTGVFLSVLGFGGGNYKDATLEKLADKGNGNYAYIDTLSEARKVLVEEMGSTLETVAKDVKIQIEFNPQKVAAYRLIGYENRLLKDEDFNNDKIDAGEMGAGHTVTALYEIVPVGVKIELPGVDPLKYSQVEQKTDTVGEWATLKVRYKEPKASTSQLLSQTVEGTPSDFSIASADLHFAASVAGLGMLVRDSEFKGSTTYDKVMNWANLGLGEDANGYRHEFVSLVAKTRDLAKDKIAYR
ncbi:VWA domain-containing protein [bacterium]|nr:VWA domain-containing protein [bacterium]